MKNFVIRWPVTENSKKMASKYLEMAKDWSLAYDAEVAAFDGRVTLTAVRFAKEMAKCTDKAARCLGFPNAAMMERYRFANGTL